MRLQEQSSSPRMRIPSLSLPINSLSSMSSALFVGQNIDFRHKLEMSLQNPIFQSASNTGQYSHCGVHQIGATYSQLSRSKVIWFCKFCEKTCRRSQENTNKKTEAQANSLFKQQCQTPIARLETDLKYPTAGDLTRKVTQCLINKQLSNQVNKQTNKQIDTPTKANSDSYRKSHDHDTW